MRRKYEDGKYLIVYEHYTRPPNAVNRFVTFLVEERLGHRLHTFAGIRVGSAICIDRADHTVQAACIVYTRKYMTGLCVGREECIKAIADRLGLFTVILDRIPTYLQCRELREIRSQRHILYLCFYRLIV